MLISSVNQRKLKTSFFKISCLHFRFGSLHFLNWGRWLLFIIAIFSNLISHDLPVVSGKSCSYFKDIKGKLSVETH